MTSSPSRPPTSRRTPTAPPTSGSTCEVDSLAVLEFVARLEYRFGIAVPDDAWPGLTSMDAVADFLETALVAAS